MNRESPEKLFGDISPEQFAVLGLDRVAYVRPAVVEGRRSMPFTAPMATRSA